MPDSTTPECTCEVTIDMRQQKAFLTLCPLHEAAPELYAALEAICQDEVLQDLPGGYLITAARAVLAKARGEQDA